jgi:hypothetical protein
MSHKTRYRGGNLAVNNIFEHVFGGFLQAIGWMLGMAAVSVFVGMIALMTKGIGLLLLPGLGFAAFVLWARHRQNRRFPPNG